MAAAFSMLQTTSYRDISIRQLAQLAGVNSAMISYHFGGKEGLIIAALKAQLDEAIPTVSAPASGQPLVSMLGEFIGQLIKLYARQPWIPRMIVDEVASKEGRMRDLYIEQIVRDKNNMMVAMLKALQQAGELRADLDPQLMQVSMISLVAFPFIAAPLLQQAFGFSLSEGNTERWIEHLTRLVLEGAANPGSAPQGEQNLNPLNEHTAPSTGESP